MRKKSWVVLVAVVGTAGALIVSIITANGLAASAPTQFDRDALTAVAPTAVKETGASLPPGVTLQPIDGGSHYYADHGFTKAAPLDNPDFFPIGIWYPALNDSGDIATYEGLGINMMDRPDGNCHLSLLAGTGIYAIPQVGECGGRKGVGIGSESVGLFTDDEADMNFGPNRSRHHPSGYTHLQRIIRRDPKKVKAGRFFWTNYAKGVMIWETRAQAAKFINGYSNTTSADFYWMTDEAINEPWDTAPWDQCAQFYGLNQNCTTDEAKRGSNYGSTVDYLRSLESPKGSQPIWGWVENGYPFTGDDTQFITPAEMNWAVWSQIIHGARGIIYFNHSFSGPEQDDNNFENPYYTTTGIYGQAKATDALIKSLAPVINDDTAQGYVTASPAPTTFSGIETMAKYHDGVFTVFADTRDSGAATNIPATFHVADAGATSVTVVNENRTIPVVDGTFSDTFATGATVHIYQVNG